MKRAIQILLFALIIVLGYMLYESIMTPIRFNREKNKRYKATIERLKDIRKAQEAYKTVYGRFTGSFDTLLTFLDQDSFRVVKKEGLLTDSLLEAGWTEKEAVAQGIISRDTIKVSVEDSLFAPKYKIDSLPYIPFSEGKRFEMASGQLLTGSKVKVQVLEVKAPNDVILHDLDRQLVVNFNDERETMTGYPGLKFGSLDEATNNAGNWE
jgi:hypothetical protein